MIDKVRKWCFNCFIKDGNVNEHSDIETGNMDVVIWIEYERAVHVSTGKFDLQYLIAKILLTLF